ncbi:VOC family protein [Novosphingobium sp. KACC 22771]|uniref:VOC family protein n=1 Tax=Novosphingobium sp. KACC 22771 TaxID=3025670 RepID=UPI00236601B1|nr:VOC family protein [Novosphingobium sp. KACC 22771]WDF71313.1 VOC family protein [Novosphingobium sp. KACC 22771]
MTRWGTAKGTLCLWYDKDLHGGAEAAADFYAGLLPDTAVGHVMRAPGDYPGGKAGDALVVEFTLLGFACIGLNGGGHTKHTDAFSIQVSTETQEETDRYWDALIADGGREMACGWCVDRWGIRWQITPRALVEGMGDADPAARGRVFAAMQTMVKIDIAAIEAARKGP